MRSSKRWTLTLRVNNMSYMPNNNFGFSLLTEKEIKTREDKLERKLEGLYSMIMPFLENLTKDEDKEYIHWPNRVPQIKSFIEEIEDFVNS